MAKFDVSYEPPISKGEHVFTILKAELRENAKVKDTENVFVQLAVAEGEYEGRQIVKTFSPFKNDGSANPIGRGLIRSFLIAVGLIAQDANGEIEVNQEQLDGLTGLAVIGKGNLRPFNGQEQWEPSSFKMHESVKQNMEAAAQTEAAPEPPAEPTPPPAKTAAAPAKTTTSAAKPAPATAAKTTAAAPAKAAAPRRSI